MPFNSSTDLSVSSERYVSNLRGFPIATAHHRGLSLLDFGSKYWLFKSKAEIDGWNNIINDIKSCRDGAFEGNTEGPSQTPKIPTPGSTGDACTLIGAPNSQIASSVINGQVCGTNESAIVQLEMVEKNGTTRTCTGTLVSQTGIVTASHCFNGAISHVYVYVGSRKVKAASFHKHPNWSASQSSLENYDVAVVLLSEPINAPVFLILPANDITAGEQVLIAGFGLTEKLKQEGLRAGYMTVSAVTELLIEARYDGITGSNSCNGDSGGPLLVKREEQWFLAGDTSNGDAVKCGVTEGTDISRWANINGTLNRAFIAQYLGV